MSHESQKIRFGLRYDFRNPAQLIGQRRSSGPGDLAQASRARSQRSDYFARRHSAGYRVESATITTRAIPARASAERAAMIRIDRCQLAVAVVRWQFVASGMGSSFASGQRTA